MEPSSQTSRESLRTVEDVRREELLQVLPWFSPQSTVLELGGGSGYQASLLASLGFTVTSIDVPSRLPRPRQYYPVRDYDGVRIPYPDDTFDAVFSSTVLGQVEQLEPLLRDVERVLRPDGVVIHILPSASWRFWTWIAFYVQLPFRVARWVMRRALRALAARRQSRSATSGRPETLSAGPATRLRLSEVLLPANVSLFPSAISEFRHYTRASWRTTLGAGSMAIVHENGNHLFYTGYLLLSRLGARHRRWLSHLLGSSCHVFVLRSAPPTSE